MFRLVYTSTNRRNSRARTLESGLMRKSRHNNDQLGITWIEGARLSQTEFPSLLEGEESVVPAD